MKKNISILLSFFMVFGVIACQKEESSDNNIPKTTDKVIYAKLVNDEGGDGQKTHLEPNGTGRYKVVWDTDDLIAIVGSNGTATYRLTEGAGTQDGKFVYYSGVSDLSGPYTAYSPSTMCEDDARTVWPAAQTYIAEGMIADAPMRAEKEAEESLSEPFIFRNMGGILRFTVKRAEGAVAKSVKSVTVTTEDDKVFSLVCKNAIEIPEGTDGVQFYMALPTGTYKGLHFEFATTGNSRLSLTAKKDIEIVRTEISSLTKTAADTEWEKEEDLQWVDLDLPSGILWANKNLGAANSTSKGNYYFWGETTPWFTYSSDNTVSWKGEYQSVAGNVNTWRESSNMKFIPSELTGYFKKYDVAFLRTGVGQMPSQADWEELKEYTNMTTVEVDGMKCLKFTSKKDDKKYIYLPLAGRYYYGYTTGGNPSLSNVNSQAYYMSNSYLTSDPDFNYRAINANSAYNTTSWDVSGNTDNSRFARQMCALPVRAIRQPNEIQFIDLGLSVLWADRNLGATSDKGKQSFGNYYMWGYTDNDPFMGFGFDNYTKWNGTWQGSGQSKFGGKYNPTDEMYTQDQIDDAAWIAGGGEYRMPTYAELEELLTYTTQQNVSNNQYSSQAAKNLYPTYGKVNGTVLTSTKEGFEGISIFIPAAGNHGQSGQYSIINCSELQITFATTGQEYGTVKQAKNDASYNPINLSNTPNKGFVGSNRFIGLCVRPVKDKVLTSK